MSREGYDQQLSQARWFQEWMESQEHEIDNILQALSLEDKNTLGQNIHEEYSRLVENCMTSYQECIDKRNMLAMQGVSRFFAPTWNSSLVNSLLWIAGCRPSLCIRLVYALCGAEVEAQVDELLQGTRTITTQGNTLGELSARQLVMINDLHEKVLKEEERLTSKLASLQEDIADQPIAVIAKQARRLGEPSSEVEQALESHDRAMVEIMREADKLRLDTIKDLTGILKPRQAVDLLAAGKKLHLCVHAWGQGRDSGNQASGSSLA